jgi:hypothetical protein
MVSQHGGRYLSACFQVCFRASLTAGAPPGGVDRIHKISRAPTNDYGAKLTPK